MNEWIRFEACIVKAQVSKSWYNLRIWHLEIDCVILFSHAVSKIYSLHKSQFEKTSITFKFSKFVLCHSFQDMFEQKFMAFVTKK